MKQWRPPEWEKTLRDILDRFNVTYMNSEEGELVEAGADAMLKAVIEWLEENKVEIQGEHNSRMMRVVFDYKWRALFKEIK